MAYQNVGTPRFYINVYEWANTVGINVMEDDLPFNPVLNTLPVIPRPFGQYMGNEPGTGMLIDLNDYVLEAETNPFSCFAAILGHTLMNNFGVLDAGVTIDIINRYPGSGYKGFSIMKTARLGKEFLQEQEKPRNQGT